MLYLIVTPTLYTLGSLAPRTTPIFPLLRMYRCQVASPFSAPVYQLAGCGVQCIQTKQAREQRSRLRTEELTQTLHHHTFSTNPKKNPRDGICNTMDKAG